MTLGQNLEKPDRGFSDSTFIGQFAAKNTWWITIKSDVYHPSPGNQWLNSPSALVRR